MCRWTNPAVMAGFFWFATFPGSRRVCSDPPILIESIDSAYTSRVKEALSGETMQAMRALLALEDGRIFRGVGYGAKTECAGEVVFNTSLSGYQEIFTDPSYAGQIV